MSKWPPRTPQSTNFCGGKCHWRETNGSRRSFKGEERQLKMKNKLIVILFPFITITTALLASDPAKHTDVQSMVAQLPVASVATQSLTAEPTSPPAAQSDKKQTLQDYDAAMILINERFSASLAAIGEAIQQGNVSGEQGREVSAEQYQMAHMQFELLSLRR